MPLTAHATSHRLEEAALEAVKAIPANSLPVPVERWEVTFGADWTNDESFFVRAVLDVDEIPRGTMTKMTRMVREAVDESGALPGAWTYLSIRAVGDPE